MARARSDQLEAGQRNALDDLFWAALDDRGEVCVDPLGVVRIQAGSCAAMP